MHYEFTNSIGAGMLFGLEGFLSNQRIDRRTSSAFVPVDGVRTAIAFVEAEDFAYWEPLRHR
jgi:hypothetical protein